jgi:hypothetical protein
MSDEQVIVPKEVQESISKLRELALTFDEYEKIKNIVEIISDKKFLKNVSENAIESHIISFVEQQLKLNWPNCKKAWLETLEANKQMKVLAFKFLPYRPEVYLIFTKENNHNSYYMLDEKMANFYAKDLFKRPDWTLC